jgi:hypothetical protein
MRFRIAVLSVVLFLAIPSYPQNPQNNVEVENDLAHHAFYVDFAPRGQIELRIRPAQIHIVGSDEERIVVRVGGRDGLDSRDVEARFEKHGKSGVLEITGGPRNDVTITVQVPKELNLVVRVFAGDVEVRDIVGDKDVELNFGALRIGVGDPTGYSTVKASVSSGEIHAKPFGESRGGLFRSLEKSDNGKYKLRAYVGAGRLTLN